MESRHLLLIQKKNQTNIRLVSFIVSLIIPSGTLSQPARTCVPLNDCGHFGKESHFAAAILHKLAARPALVLFRDKLSTLTSPKLNICSHRICKTTLFYSIRYF